MTTSQLLRTAGLRRTNARESLLSLLLKAKRPLSQQEIAERPETDHFDRVTLYRTLSTLQKAGLMHRVQGVDGVWRFRAHTTDHRLCPGNHSHFLCLECSKMTCLSEQPLPWISVPEGSQVKGKQLVVYGLCSTCAAKEEKSIARSGTGKTSRKKKHR